MAQAIERPVTGNKWAIEIGAGWSHRTVGIEDRISEQLQEYAKGLVNGWHLRGGGDRMLGTGLGFGLAVDHARWSASDPAIALTDVYGESGIYALEDRIGTTFIGAGVRLRHGAEGAKTHLDTDVDVGIAVYRHVTLIDTEQLTINGANVALRLHLGIETRLASRTGLLIGFTYLHCRVNEVKIDDREGSRWLVLYDRELLLHRLDVSAGVRFHL